MRGLECGQQQCKLSRFTVLRLVILGFRAKVHGSFDALWINWEIEFMMEFEYSLILNCFNADLLLFLLINVFSLFWVKREEEARWKSYWRWEGWERSSSLQYERWEFILYFSAFRTNYLSCAFISWMRHKDLPLPNPTQIHPPLSCISSFVLATEFCFLLTRNEGCKCVHRKLLRVCKVMQCSFLIYTLYYFDLSSLFFWNKPVCEKVESKGRTTYNEVRLRLESTCSYVFVFYVVEV